MPPVDVRVLAVRPTDMDGELHGLYEPDEELPTARISVWMRTAQKKQVVAFRSFVRTVVHEFLHHLDYEHFKLPETFHTEGFYRRESSLANALFEAGDAAVDASEEAASRAAAGGRRPALIAGRIAVKCATCPEERCNSRRRSAPDPATLPGSGCTTSRNCAR